MSKYTPLGEFLRAHDASAITLTFTEIETIIGGSLPPKAQHHRAWWSNNPSNNVMTKVWLEAGYQTEQVDMGARKLVFRRFGRPRRQIAEGSSGDRALGHPLQGALKGMVTTLPGTDVTKPADPEWASQT